MNTIDFSIVHHANQYLITNGYQNREGLDDVLGIRGGSTGYRRVFELHEQYKVPFNLHVSGTLLEAILWHRPDFLDDLRSLMRQGLVNFITSSYGQNIMRFFGHHHNFRQLNECLNLYRDHFEVDPQNEKVFWVPERLWDTRRLAPVLTDTRLLNKGYEYVLIDDRLLYPIRSGSPSRSDFDQGGERNLADFYSCSIVNGHGLWTLPICYFLRQNIPPRDRSVLDGLEGFFHWLAEKNSEAECRLIAIYADDLEKSAGCCGWNGMGTAHYETFLEWLTRNPWVRPVKLNEWAAIHCESCQKPIEVGSFFEMSHQFGAGENYGKWFCDPNWHRYRDYYTWAEGRVRQLSAKGADPTLMEMAWKHLLASSWETAWHTPFDGVHGDPSSAGEPSPWIKALGSHTRHAAIIAEAAYWMHHKEAAVHASLEDIDNDGNEELILKNEALFAVFSPLCGGRLLYLFSTGGDQGKMVIGNPSDDWNWQEELNDYMQIPPNHPGALTDIGHENDRYEAVVHEDGGEEAKVVLINRQEDSQAFGLEKWLRLVRDKNEIEVTYRLPPSLPYLSVECGFSPDYLNLLRSGRTSLKEYTGLNMRGYSNNGVSVWVRIEDSSKAVFDNDTSPREFGHGYAIQLRALSSPFTIHIGTKQWDE